MIQRTVGCVQSVASAGALARAAAAAAVLALLQAGAPQALAADALVLRDDLGRDVTFAHPPRRIVSLLPSVTETLCALGACNRLIATDRFSDWPAEVRSLPKTGRPRRSTDRDHRQTSARSRSDQRHAAHHRSIARARVVDLRPEIGELCLHCPHRDRVSGRYSACAERAAGAQAADRCRGAGAERQVMSRRRGAAPSVYFEVDRTPYAAGPSSFIGELLELLGARNIVSADLGAFPAPQSRIYRAP